MTNIAVNCRLLQKGKLEGIGWFMYETLKRITKEHPEHRFYFIFDRPYDAEFVFSDNVTPIVAGPQARHPFLWYYWMEYRIPSILKKVKADIFYSPDGYLSLRTKVPSVPVIHDINFAHRPKDLPFWVRHYYNYFFPRFAKKADRLCTVSEYSRQDIAKTYEADVNKIHVVYNGANTDFRPASESDIGAIRAKYSGGKPYFLFIGSFHPRKNLTNLIQAFEKFCDKTTSDIKLVIVGSEMWKGRNSFRGLINRKNEDRYVFTGRLEAEELKQVLSAAFALTFVPWFEGFGIPVLEAFYAGIPVLTSTETSLPEVGGSAAIYAYPGSINEIADGMDKLARDKKMRDDLIERGEKQKQLFSWDKTAENVWECLEMVISGLNNKNEK